MSNADRHGRMLEIADQLRREGRRPYVMPSGGSDEVGALGYVRAVSEIDAQLAKLDRGIGCIVHACGSGGTYAGCFLGKLLCELNVRHIAAVVDGTVESWRETLIAYISRTAQHWSLNISARPDDINLIDAAGRGYALNTEDELDFIVAFARQTGVFLDPVYTGKALYAFDREMRSGRVDPGGNVLFVHTGGMFGLFAQKDGLTAAVKRRDAVSQPWPLCSTV
jgi:D-cysteine desulfhydrase